MYCSWFSFEIESMQFEWAVKHAPPRRVGGVNSRIQKLYHVCCQEKWTNNSPLAKYVPYECLKVIKNKKPNHFILENVKGLITIDGGKTFDSIIKEIKNLSCGMENIKYKRLWYPTK